MTLFYSIAWVLLFLVGCATEPERGQSQFPAVLAADLQAILDSELDALNAPGATVTVQLPDGTRWSGAAGYAHVASDVAVEAGDRFRIGSVTKTFVAAVVMQLVEEDRWSLDDSIDMWVSGYAFGPEVTLRRLLSHTSGVNNFTDDESFLSHDVTEPADIIDFSLLSDPVGEPGQHYVYSNTGFILLGLAIESASGQPLHEVIRQRLLEPLELHNTYLEGQEVLDGGHVSGYVAGVDAAIVLPQFDMNWAWAAGAMVSNGEDQCHWLRELVLPTDDAAAPVNAASRAAMQTPQPTTDDGLAPYGLGLMLYQRADRPVIGHTGSTMGFKGEVFVDADTGACVSIQTNDFLSEPGNLREAIWSQLDNYLRP